MKHILQTDVVTLTFIAGSVIPLLVGLLTKVRASAGLKAGLNLLLSIAGGVIAAWIQAGGGITVAQLVSAAVLTYFGSQATYHGLWKPTGIADALAQKTGTVGLGTGAPTTPVGGSSGGLVTPTSGAIYPPVGAPTSQVFPPAVPEIPGSSAMPPRA